MFGLGDQASASETVSTSASVSNSQTIELLQSSTSLSSASDIKDPSVVKEDENVNIMNENALLPSTSSMGTDSDNADASIDQIEVYVVRKGDSVADIAKMFDVSTNTILWANDLKKGEKLTEGDTLIILPVSGVKHVVKKGDTLKTIAKKYGVDVFDITSFNNIDLEKGLSVGDELVIPGAEIQSAPVVTISKKKGTLPAYNDRGIKSSTGYFIKPIPCALSQGRHDRYAVDLSCHGSGTPIKAAASGKVIFAKIGWNGAFGNLVIIDHPNGMRTYYGHQKSLNVSVGQQVEQGQVIGYVGSTGRSTGPHLHFEVRGGWNPGFDNSWAQ